MDEMIYPEIFDGKVMGFFTGKGLGIDVEPLVGRPVYMPLQRHTNIVMALGDSLRPRKADAVITDRHDIMLGVQVADCVPILLYDAKKRIIGAVHAGWKGTASGILKRTLKLMAEKFGSKPSDILMAAGPSIRVCCYEVGQDVLKAVVKQTGKGDYHNENGRKPYLDLTFANKQQAVSSGVPERHIWTVQECTMCHPHLFHSYRFSKRLTGQQGGFIGLP